MKRIRTVVLVPACLGLCALFNHGRLLNARGEQTNTFEWSARPQLSPKQERLLQLESSRDQGREGSPLRIARQAEFEALQKELGPLAVRHAKANELILSPGAATNLSRIFNPTKEGLVLTVSVMGDTEQMGTRRASMGRETYLPPGSTVIVSNLYWTTPGTKREK